MQSTGEVVVGGGHAVSDEGEDVGRGVVECAQRADGGGGGGAGGGAVNGGWRLM